MADHLGGWSCHEREIIHGVTDLLLGDTPLHGSVGVQRWLTPERNVHLVNPSSGDDAAGAIESACNIWGGAYHVLVPVPDGATDIDEPWRTLAALTDPSWTAVRGRLPIPESQGRKRLGGTWVENSGHGDLALAVLAYSEKPDRGYRTVRVANEIPTSDPWWLAYTGVWGRLPATIDANSLRYSGLLTDLGYSDVLTVDDSVPAECGAADLLQSLRNPQWMTGTDLSCVKLGRASAPLGSQFGAERPDLPIRFHEARECGPNIVVVYEPGSVTDLCLLWHLRAVHGLRPGFPLAIPTTADLEKELAYWWQERAMQPWGLRPTVAYLTSSSVSFADLEKIAEGAGQQWSAIAWQQLLQPSWGCGISSSEIVAFEDGEAQILGLHPVEEAALGRDVLENVAHSLELVVRPNGRALPASMTLARGSLFEAYRGGAVLQQGRTRETISFRWPTGLTVVDAVLRDRRLRSEPSAPGRVAQTLLEQTEDIGGLVPLMLPDILSLLDELSERHGMNWFKRKLRHVLDIGEPVPDDVATRLDRIEEQVRSLAGTPAEEERSSATFDDVKRALGGDRAATEAWLEWADAAGLLVRGVIVKCGRCSAALWRSVHELTPAVICPSCGRRIERPHGNDLLKFRYRATEFLLRLMKDDALVHALTLRFVSELFSPSFNQVGPIVGAYPGVTILSPERPDPVGEADVLFVMLDGGLGVGECKSSAAGLTQEELDKLGRLADLTSATWTFTATLEPAAMCGPVWRASPTAGRLPHYALTAEHLLDPVPINALGSEPLAWRPAFVRHGSSEPQTAEEHAHHVISTVREFPRWQAKRGKQWWTETDDGE